MALVRHRTSAQRGDGIAQGRTAPTCGYVLPRSGEEEAVLELLLVGAKDLHYSWATSVIE